MTVHPRTIPKPTVLAKKPLAERLSIAGSWLFVWLAFLLCGLGSTMLVQQVRHTPLSQLAIVAKDPLSPVEYNSLKNAIQPHLGAGYFFSDLVAIRDAALSLTWVDDVGITRRWPNGIVVKVTPALPIARWGSGRLVNSEGRIFTPLTPANRDDLPVIFAQDDNALEVMMSFFAINQWFNPVGLSLKELYITPQQTAILIFNNGLRVTVDQEYQEQKLQYLSILIRTDLKDTWQNILTADLRYRSGLAVRWRSNS